MVNDSKEYIIKNIETIKRKYAETHDMLYKLILNQYEDDFFFTAPEVLREYEDIIRKCLKDE